MDNEDSCGFWQCAGCEICVESPPEWQIEEQEIFNG